MEYVSYLAGERWNDHPPCTHPALAFLARMVNDCTTDRNRSRLTGLIPSVIGLTGDHPAVGTVIAIRCAVTALPVVSEERQQALAVGLLCCQQTLTSPGSVALIHQAFEQAPQAERWARRFLTTHQTPDRNRSIARMTESIIRTSVLGIVEACIADPDERLRNLLADAIGDCARLLRPAGTKIMETRMPIAG